MAGASTRCARIWASCCQSFVGACLTEPIAGDDSPGLDSQARRRRARPWYSRCGRPVLQVLSPHWEPTFHPSSHGFRPGRSCHTAIAEAKQYLEEGYDWVVDLDLEKFFDRVHHQRLVARLETKVKDRRLMTLIQRMLKAKVVMPEGVVVNTDEGVPQGGPLSPLLSNIVLDELDQELAQRGHRFVRYADDANIYVRSERAGHRVMVSVVRFIETHLRLTVN